MNESICSDHRDICIPNYEGIAHTCKRKKQFESTEGEQFCPSGTGDYTYTNIFHQGPMCGMCVNGKRLLFYYKRNFT